MVYRFQLDVIQKINKKMISGNSPPVFDENDFDQFLIESGNIENKIKNRLKQ